MRLGTEDMTGRCAVECDVPVGWPRVGRSEHAEVRDYDL